MLTALTLFTSYAAATPPVAPPDSQTNAYAGDYAAGTHMNGLYHWRHFPVRVYFDAGGAYTPERQQAALTGFDEWTEATNGAISYRLTDSARDADLTVSFLNSRNVGDRRRTIGQTMTLMRRGTSYLFRAKMELATQGMASDFLTEIAAHEFGHALGINGHSDDEGDLMYPSATRYVTADGAVSLRQKRPTQRDLNTLRRAYPALGGSTS